MRRLSGQHRSAEVSTVASQQDGHEFATQLRQGLSVQSLHVLPRDMPVRLIGHSKFPVGVNVKVNGCLSLYVSPVTNWRLVQGVTLLLAQCQLGSANNL